MIHKLSKLGLVTICILAFTCLNSYANDQGSAYIPVSWDQLIPADYNLDELENELISKYDVDNITPGSLEADTLIQQLQQLQYDAPMVTEYDNIKVKIPGFIVPLDFESDKITHFLLVPYFGACIHTPPPPPNQIVYVIMQEGIRVDNTYDPIYINGVMRVESQDSEMGTAGYTVYGASIEPYVY
ncbi:DUF3299 domain-containing protein [Reinekea sp.]|jgi:hypothetical protein|uniref:DUF3299 domain-containing protein n=1 Tax=Reinekea sp. TaxID=1970455 RepID=UPI003989C8E9